MDIISAICAINSALIISSVLNSGSVRSQELFSKCDFVTKNSLSCQWNNSDDNHHNWTMSDIDLISNSSDNVYHNLNALLMKNSPKETKVFGSYESRFFRFGGNSTNVCLTIQYILSHNSSEVEVRLTIEVIDRSGDTIGSRECGTSVGGTELLQTCDLSVRTQSPNETDIQFAIHGTIDSPNERFIAIRDISMTVGSCLTPDSVLLFSHNGKSHNVSTEVNQTSEQIGPRITFWVVLMSVITILAIVVFIYIGISNIKKEHKKRSDRIKTGNNSIEEVDGGLTEEEIFDDEFQILPRGSSFIMHIFRQISSTVKSDKPNE